MVPNSHLVPHLDPRSANCVRLYSTAPLVYYVIDAWWILGPAPIIRNSVHPSIPHGFLPKNLDARARDYPHAKDESKVRRGNGSSQYIVNMWALIWGSHISTPGALVFPNVMFECVSLRVSIVCGLPTWFIGETYHEKRRNHLHCARKTRRGNRLLIVMHKSHDSDQGARRRTLCIHETELSLLWPISVWYFMLFIIHIQVGLHIHYTLLSI